MPYKIPHVKVYPSRSQFILDTCLGKDVLHLGCTDARVMDNLTRYGTHLHVRLMQICKHLVGVDIDKRGLAKMRAAGIEDVCEGNVESLQEILGLTGKRFDVVVAGEIFEHINNPGLALQGIKKHLRPGGKIVVTVPSAFSLIPALRTLTGYEHVNPDQNFYFSWKTLSTLMEKNGYEIEQMVTYTLESRTKSSWLRRIRLQITRAYLFRLLYWRNPFFADGIICVAHPVVA